MLLLCFTPASSLFIIHTWLFRFVYRYLSFKNGLQTLSKMLIEWSRECNNHKPQPTLDTKRKRKRTKTYMRKNKQTNVRETQRQASSSASEMIRMLKQTEKRWQRAREHFKTRSAPRYKPQSSLKPEICSYARKHFRSP